MVKISDTQYSYLYFRDAEDMASFLTEAYPYIKEADLNIKAACISSLECETVADMKKALEIFAPFEWISINSYGQGVRRGDLKNEK